MPLLDAADDVGVIVTITADVNVDSTRPEPSVTPVVKDVESIGEGDGAAEPDDEPDDGAGFELEPDAAGDEDGELDWLLL